jgi:hypothetical protein
MKNVSVEELERALEAALLSVAGRAVKVSVAAMEFDEVVSRVDIKLSAWEKLSPDPFSGAI